MPTYDSWMMILTIAKLLTIVFIIVCLLRIRGDEKKRKKQFNRNGRHYQPEAFTAHITAESERERLEKAFMKVTGQIYGRGRAKSDIYATDETLVGELPHPPGRQYGVARSINEAYPPWRPRTIGSTRSMLDVPRVSIGDRSVDETYPRLSINVKDDSHANPQ